MHLIELNCLFMTLTNAPWMYINTVLSLLHVSAPWGWHDTKTCRSHIRLYVCI